MLINQNHLHLHLPPLIALLSAFITLQSFCLNLFQSYGFLSPSIKMGKLWVLISQLHSLAGPVVTLLYPLYASVVAIESTSKLDDEQWLAYWILYSFLTLVEMVLQPLLQWVPIWYDVKLMLVAWLVLPQFKGAAFLYERFVRHHIRKHITDRVHKSPKKAS